MKVRFTKKSANSKTGPIPVTMTEQKSCADCPLKKNGCYSACAHLLWLWKKTATEGLLWTEFCANIKSLPEGQLWRHNVVGDLPNKDGFIDVQKLKQLVEAAKHTKGFTYTHLDPLKGENAKWIKWANDHGFTISLSANSPNHAKFFRALNFDIPIVTMIESENDRGEYILCPATHHDITCAHCKICANPKRKSIIAFPVHGTAKNKAKKVVEQYETMYANA